MPEKLAAQYLGVGTTMLRESGPQFKRWNKRVLYDRVDLDRWADKLAGQPFNRAEKLLEAAEVERRFLANRAA